MTKTKKPNRAAFVAALACFVGGTAARAQHDGRQAATGGVAAFDAASVKPGDPDAPGMGTRVTLGRIELQNLPLTQCLEYAYSLGDRQLSRPAWMDSASFTIVATPGMSAGDSRVRLMLQTLLRERFKIAAHWETRTVQGFALARQKAAPRLRKSQAELGGALPDRGC